jgi:hypothetical protein
MGSSFIRFRDQGFEASDDSMEVLLALIVREIDSMDCIQDWLRELRDDWATQATEGFGFGIVPDLDRYVTDEIRRDVILDLCRRTMSKLESLGDVIPREQLNALNTGGEGSTFTRDVPAVIFLRPARYFMRLLESKLEPWESDARFEPDK